MREIKFRAWNGEAMINRTLFDRNWYSKDDKCVMGATPRDARTLKVMQFTGLKDKNGVDIYEGDIVKFEDIEDQSNESNGAYQECFTNTGSVYYSLCCNGWDVSGREVGRDDAFYDLEVIGNIYENPELLEVE